jgi:hypothetical protein
VVLGDKLCGHIIAARQDIPWLYMVPICATFEDMKKLLHTDDVRLPNASEIDLNLTMTLDG